MFLFFVGVVFCIMVGMTIYYAGEARKTPKTKPHLSDRKYKRRYR